MTRSWEQIRPTAAAMHPQGGEVCDLAQAKGLEADAVTCLSAPGGPKGVSFALYFGNWNERDCKVVSSDDLAPT